jgi:RHH-type transcriptional regulator, rel operon repressor / antitoxin RelB
MLDVRLPPEIERRLVALARKTGRSKSYYAREAILRQLEDIIFIWRGAARNAAVRASRSRAWSAIWPNAAKPEALPWLPWSGASNSTGRPRAS